MDEPRQSGLHWPGWRQLCFAYALGIGCTVFFAAVYGGADWLARQHTYRVHLHTDTDLHIPFVPMASPVYLSLNALFWISPFILRTRAELVAFVKGLMWATVLAGVGFVLLPAEAAFSAPSGEKLGVWRVCYDTARAIALENNFFPSLHVAFTVICWIVMVPRLRTLGRIVVSCWALAIVASTLLTHQHYLADVGAGLILAPFAVRFARAPRPAQRKVLATQTDGPTPEMHRASSV